MSISPTPTPFVGRIRIHYFRSPLPLLSRRTLLATCTTGTTTTTEAPPQRPSIHFAAVDYLVQSCGLPFDKSLSASKRIHHLKSPDKPDAVLRFLRQLGIEESNIRTAVSRDSRLLCSSVEKNLRPNIKKLLEVGLSIKDISGIISKNPCVFLSNFVPKVDFWLGVLGSEENLSLVLKREPAVLISSIERVIMPNITLLQEQCGLSVPQTVHLIKLAPRLIISNPATLKVRVERAENLGIPRSSRMYQYALILVSNFSQRAVDARIDKFKSLGFSQEEIALMISKAPYLFNKSGELIARSMEFLIKEAGCSTIDVVRNPALLMYSLQNRLVPRTAVRKLLMSKGIPAANRAFVSFVQPSEEEFVKKFIVPYEQAVPGLHRAYADAGKIGGVD